jgi:esterase/lipase superfamily enzyme
MQQSQHRLSVVLTARPALVLLCAILTACAAPPRVEESASRAGSPAPVVVPAPPPPPAVAAAPPPRPAPAPAPPPASPPSRAPAAAAPPSAADLEAVVPPAVEAVDRTVKLWYGTNRAPTDPFVSANPYGAARDQKLNYGVCEVFVPKSHRRGSLGSHVPFSSDKPLVFRSATPLPEDRFWADMTESLRKVASTDKVVLVFIHGYKNTFTDAAIRTAQLWADLHLQGIPAFFSWPSRGTGLAYTADEATVDSSEKYLEEFLLQLRAKVGATQPIHIIAHSMGNRALLRVAAKLQDRLHFGQVILAAPDVDVDLFLGLAEAYTRISDRTTLYVSRHDRAVWLSEGVHDMDRVGAPPAFANVQNVDTVEVVAKTGLLDPGHSYFAELGDLLDDMAGLLQRNPGRATPYKGSRVDARAECRYPGGDVRTSESCWRILVKQ